MSFRLGQGSAKCIWPAQSKTRQCSSPILSARFLRVWKLRWCTSYKLGFKAASYNPSSQHHRPRSHKIDTIWASLRKANDRECQASSRNQWSAKIVRIFEPNSRIAEVNRKLRQRANTKSANQTRQENFAFGQKSSGTVKRWSRPVLEVRNKSDPLFDGPFQVMKINGPNVTAIKDKFKIRLHQPDSEIQLRANFIFLKTTHYR